MRHSRFRLAVVSLALLAACAARAESRPHYGGTLDVVVRDEPSGAFGYLIFENLTTLDEAGKPQPQLATSWESQSGDRRWQFWIRSGVRFHDGTPLTAATAVASLTANECESCPWTTVRAVGDSVVFEFADARPQFAAELALPRYPIVTTNPGRTSSTGPFRYGPSANGLFTLQAYDDYWQGRPFLDAIKVHGPRTPGAADYDLARTHVVQLGPEQARRIQPQAAHLGAFVSRPVDLVALAMRTAKPPLQDVRVRSTIALSLDRAAILNFVFQKQGEVAGGLLPNWISGYAFLLPHERDLPRAQQLRREVANLPPLIIAAGENDPALQLIAERIALNARDAGITLQTGSVDRADLVVQRRSLYSTNPAIALAQMFGYFSTEHVPQASSAQQLYETERELVGRYQFVPLVYLPRTYYFAPRVRNWTATADGALRLQDFWLSQ